MSRVRDWSTGENLNLFSLAKLRGLAGEPKPRKCSCGALYRRAESSAFPWLCTRCSRKAQGLPRDVRGAA